MNTTGNAKESLEQIGASVQRRREDELDAKVRIAAVGRAMCTVKSSKFPQSNGTYPFWITNKQDTAGVVVRRDFTGTGVGSISSTGSQTLKDGMGMTVYKNTRLGEILIKNASGTHNYVTPTFYKRPNEMTVTIHNRTSYSPKGDSAIELTINLEDEPQTFFFQKLEDLLRDKRQKEEELRLKIEQEKELERQRQEALRKQQEAEAKRAEEEAKKAQEDIKKMEKELEETTAAIRRTQSFIRNEVALRNQHFLDPTQEDAKRSHLFDGVPIVIEGGPGTGKTTTMIQRLKFLISDEALKDYEAPLTNNQIEELTDASKVNSNWLFFSPTPLLLSYLRNNMVEEGLAATEDRNVITVDRFREIMLSEYKLRDISKDRPFKYYNPKKGENTLVLETPDLIIAFEDFCIKNICAILLNAYQLKTNDFSWHNLAVEIKSVCLRAEKVKNMNDLMNIFNSLFDNTKADVRLLETEMKDAMNKLAQQIKTQVVEDAALSVQVQELFDRWYLEEEETVEEEDLQEGEMDESEEEDAEDLAANSSKIDMPTKLYNSLKPILRALALKPFTRKFSPSKKQKELYDIVKPVVDDKDLNKLGELAWFVKNYAFLCKGLESNILNQIPRLYKLFRKDVLANDSDIFNTELLAKMLKKNKNYLHPEELSFLLGFINNLLLDIYKRSKLRFQKLRKQKYIKAFLENMKPVIGVDEATDYSLLDYYMISSFRHYEYSTLTLCGDIMQGLNGNGINSWAELKDFILPKLEVCELKTSYRQLPALVDMSKAIYADDQGKEAPYETKKERFDDEVKPLAFVTDDEDEEAHWIAKRIQEVSRTYSGTLPSVAVFIGDNESIEDYVELLREQDELNGIKIVDGKTTTSARCVRVYHLSQVKGMEFEIAFFLHIDRALGKYPKDLMRRYLYVGISRATSHLGATFTEEDGNEDILKYFDRNAKNWKL